MEYIVKISTIFQVTHNVRCLRFEKPKNYSFVPGHAADVSINKPEWIKEKRPFTFTALNEERYLEFTIKCYSDHDGVTNQVGQLKEGDELIISDSWGAIEYKGKGCFIAGGAGITPFMAIFRQLQKEGQVAGNKLFFSNKTEEDIIYKEELKKILGDAVIFVLTDKNAKGYQKGYIDEDFLEANVDNFNQSFYICGPDQMIKTISDILIHKGAAPDRVVFEK